jgi:hypothetical protein
VIVHTHHTRMQPCSAALAASGKLAPDVAWSYAMTDQAHSVSSAAAAREALRGSDYASHTRESIAPYVGVQHG